MMQVIAPEKAKSVTDIRNIIEKWESRVLVLQRDFQKKVSSKMKAAILISILPTDLRDSLIQFVEYQSTKEKVIAIVEAKIAMRSPDEMDVDELTWWNADEENDNDEIHSLSKGGICCHRSGGQGHIASKCGTPESATFLGMCVARDSTVDLHRCQ